MKDSILEKLQFIADRHEEVGVLLGEPNVISDQNNFRILSKEYSENEPVSYTHLTLPTILLV